MKPLSESILDYIESKGIDTIFCMPGATIYPLLKRASNRSLKIITLHHEQFLVHAAEGYTHVSKTPAIVFVSSGPALTNCITGLANAYFDYRSILLIVGQVNSEYKDKKLFQALDIVSTTSSVTRLSIEAQNAQDAFDRLVQLYSICNGEVKGPCLLSIPVNYFEDEISKSNNVHFSLPKPTPSVTEVEVKKISNLIEESNRPMIILGKGINNLEESVVSKFINKYKIPFFSTFHSLGFLSNNDNYKGIAGEYADSNYFYSISNCDLLIILGSSLNERTIGKDIKFKEKCVKIYINNEISKKTINIDYFIQTDIFIFFDRINLMEFNNTNLPFWLDWGNELSNSKLINNFGDKPIEELKIKSTFEKISSLISTSDYVVADCGLNQIWTAKYLRLLKPNQFLTTGGFGTMGFSLAASIGMSIKIGNDSKIWCIIGDGGFMNCLSLIFYLNKNGCNINILLFNNSGYGIIRENLHSTLSANHQLYDFSFPYSDITKAADLDFVSLNINHDFEEILKGLDKYKSCIIEIVI